ncbi:LuxR C-terminal-related transcriptional regulator [Nocardia huaxiensis]|uniref:LuxR C-terminal-related transcriptional regulator n=1 Tax=Nocardia huaxiensis TaxID=2755382 RepID=UPI001E48435D|nr:LuxR C-terminal-related transcriptional regulator [Nocardia huaxiensis]UFS98053.1 LuxR C-terminal-related transcriptional regulator [Nocardia huaxiensis]
MTTSQRTTNCPRSALERTAPGRIPAPHCEPIARPELDSRFAPIPSATGAHIVQIWTPAGSGKTVLLHDWLQRRLAARPDTAVAWLTMTEVYDRDPSTWHPVAESLTEVLGLPTPPPGTVKPVHYMALLTDALLTRTTPTVLILDDAHLLTNPLLLVAVEYLIRYAPPTVTIVLAGRYEIALRWHSLNAQRRVTRIGAEDLTLTGTQAAQLFRQHGCEIPDGDLDAVMALTHGWAALVRIAAIRMEAAECDHAAALAELARPAQPVVDFLIGDVLTDLPWRSFEFLMRTSVPDHFTEDLADVLHGSRAHEILDELASHGVPLTRTSHEGTLWFTYHPLLRSYLLAEIERRDEAEVARLRLITARWLSAAGRSVAALSYLLRLDDDTYLRGFLREHGLGLVLDGHGALLFAELAEAGTPLIDDAFVWRLRAVHALTRGEDGHARTYANFAAEQPGACSALVPPEWLEVLDVAITADTAIAGGTGIAVIDPPDTLSPTGNPDVDCYVCVQSGTAMLLQGRFDRAAAQLTTGLTLSEHFARPRLTLQAMTRLAIACGYAGAITEMRTRSDQAIEFARQHDLVESPDTQRARVAACIARYIQGDDWATDIVGDPSDIDSVPPGMPVDGLPTGVDWQLLATVAATDKHAAVRRLRFSLRNLLHRHPMPAVGVGLLLTATTGILVRLHEFRAAEELLTLAEPVIGEIPGFVIARALATDAAQKPRSTRALLEPVLHGDAPIHPINAVTGWLLYADALHRLGMPSKAVEALDTALRLSQPERVLRPWLNLPVAIELLDAYAGRFGPGDEFADLLRHHPAAQRADAAPALTESEMIVLKHLPSGRTGGQIAADLGVSINTVKTHLRGLYTKLRANSRAEAVARARVVGLL